MENPCFVIQPHQGQERKMQGDDLGGKITQGKEHNLGYHVLGSEAYGGGNLSEKNRWGSVGDGHVIPKIYFS